MNEETKDHIIEVIAIAGILIGAFAVPAFAYMTGQVPLPTPTTVNVLFFISIVTLCYLEILHCLHVARESIKYQTRV
jgi:membrane protein YdbS with pleckstrin-like domain